MLMLSIYIGVGLNDSGAVVGLTGPQERFGHEPVYNLLSDIR